MQSFGDRTARVDDSRPWGQPMTPPRAVEGRRNLADGRASRSGSGWGGQPGLSFGLMERGERTPTGTPQPLSELPFSVYSRSGPPVPRVTPAAGKGSAMGDYDPYRGSRRLDAEPSHPPAVAELASSGYDPYSRSSKRVVESSPPEAAVELASSGYDPYRGSRSTAKPSPPVAEIGTAVSGYDPYGRSSKPVLGPEPPSAGSGPAATAYDPYSRSSRAGAGSAFAAEKTTAASGYDPYSRSSKPAAGRGAPSAGSGPAATANYDPYSRSSRAAGPGVMRSAGRSAVAADITPGPREPPTPIKNERESRAVADIRIAGEPRPAARAFDVLPGRRSERAEEGAKVQPSEPSVPSVLDAPSASASGGLDGWEGNLDSLQSTTALMSKSQRLSEPTNESEQDLASLPASQVLFLPACVAVCSQESVLGCG